MSALFIFASTLGQAVASDDILVGSIKSIDKSTKKIVLNRPVGSTTVTYWDVTEWPWGLRDPLKLVGKKVRIVVDDFTGLAASVERLYE
jgi:hypothetical protein